MLGQGGVESWAGPFRGVHRGGDFDEFFLFRFVMNKNSIYVGPPVQNVFFKM